MLNEPQNHEAFNPLATSCPHRIHCWLCSGLDGWPPGAGDPLWPQDYPPDERQVKQSRRTGEAMTDNSYPSEQPSPFLENEDEEDEDEELLSDSLALLPLDPEQVKNLFKYVGHHDPRNLRYYMRDSPMRLSRRIFRDGSS
ncbi:MAG TPA: hypothetical protein VH593_31840 [Ktedonobacteraceae bacterium]